MESPRPFVSVVVPFHGDADHARLMLAALARLELLQGDELIVSDNTAEGVARDLVTAGVAYVWSGQTASSYYARNVGADAAHNDWLLFIDSDCVPRPEVLDRYFQDGVDEGVGAIAGEVLGEADQGALTSRYSRSRRHIGQAEIQDHPYRPMAVTANLLVRRAAWSELGGFQEGIRSGGDADFSWRLQDAGWGLAYAPHACVEHRHRETLRALLRQSARYGAGMRWLTRRHPEATFGGWLRPLARCFIAMPVLLVTGRRERAAFKALDALWIVANTTGSLASNVTRTEAAPDDLVLIADVVDVRVAAEARRVAATGRPLRIESARREQTPDRDATRGLRVNYMEDDGPLLRWSDLFRIAVSHPLLAAGDVLTRLRTGRGEQSRTLRELAPVVRRLRRGGAAEIVACGQGETIPLVYRLARLSGTPVGDSSAGGGDEVPIPPGRHTEISDKP